MHTAIHWLKKILYIIAIILLINMGLMPLGFNIFQSDFMQFTAPWLIAPLHYLAGIAGIIMLIAVIGCLTNKSGCMCGGSGSYYGKGGCSCGSKMS
ncbi:MAG TPA: hypothetical protein VGW78_06525 [Candidatus Babeliales bacterium]|jgi:hypothetical protein|nr:hypothetical protein [Candidatus Babeliales bacterium]